MKWFENKRKQVAKSLPEKSALVLESWPISFRQPDVPYPYRQESNFYYLTGFKEPESFFILTKEESILFIQKKDPLKEVWDGYRYTTEEVKKIYLMDKVYTVDNWEGKTPFYLRGIKTLYTTNINPSFKKKRSLLKGVVLKSAQDFLAPFRRIKDSAEILHMKEAVGITAKAHREVALALRPGISERMLHGVFIKTLMENGSPREAYISIVACGANATVLHYKKNSSICREGELLLLDAGAERNYYASDITRVYPVNGTFTEEQKDIYEKLLALQKDLVKAVKPGVDMQTLNQQMIKGVIRILLSLGVLKGSLSENISNAAYKTYLPHGVGHLIGLDVHDPLFSSRNAPRILKPGMVITVEPGLYFPKTCPLKSLRGMGLRIEDNVLVTDNGQENLSQCIPKEADEVQALCSA